MGNAWLRDDGFGGEVARRLRDRPLQGDVAVMDAGTGGLDLAYEVMRGYDALIILDVSRQGGEPGTLYVMEPDEQSVDGEIEDGSTINPHGMDPQTVLRFIKSIGGVARPGDRDRLRAGGRRGARLRPVATRSQAAVDRASSSSTRRSRSCARRRPAEPG